VVIGHSLGGLVARDFASAYPEPVAAAVVIDSPLLPRGDRPEVVRDLAAGLRGPDPRLKRLFAQGARSGLAIRAGAAVVLDERAAARVLI
jgi:pimeloyl-ACP methyl ester carboxylesterase